MRILHLGKFYPPAHGGVERVIAELVEGCNAAGLQTDVLCANEILKTQTTTYRIGKMSYTIMRAASFGKLARTAIAPMMIAHLRSLAAQYDIIHVHHPDPMAALALFLVRPKAKIVLQWHADIVRQKRLLRFYAPLLRWLIRRADVVVGATRAHIEDSDYTPLFAPKGRVIPYSITPLAPQENCIELDKRFFNVFALGRLVYYKGFAYLIDAANALDESFRIFIGGDGALYRNLSEQIVRHNLQNRVFLLGALSTQEICNYFEQCDVFVLPSIERTEMFGIVQLEAMGFGKPVVATKIERSGVHDVNVDMQSGLIVPACDSQALAGALRTLKDDKALYTQLAQGARERIRAFLPEQIIPQWHALYRGLCEG